jgi:hypothetical protein
LTKPGTDAGAMPVKVSLRVHAAVTAGFANAVGDGSANGRGDTSVRPVAPTIGGNGSNGDVMADQAPNAAQPLHVGTAVVIVIVSVLVWQNIGSASRFTTAFVDRSAAAEACMTARTIEDNLPPLPRTSGGLIDFFGSSPEADAARAARAAERRDREIRLRAAAERSRDEELRRAAASGPEEVLRVCIAKGYPR